MFVRDRKNHTGSLVNQVQVSVEIIDINDSTPTCSSSTYTKFNELGRTEEKTESEIRKQTLDSFSIRIEFNKLAHIFNPDSPANRYELAKIYTFKCTDNDINKNAKLKYHLQGLLLKDLVTGARVNTKNMSMSIKDSARQFRTWSHQQNRQSNINDESIFSTYKIFFLNSASGELYLNLTLDWTGRNSEFLHKFAALVNKKFIVLKVRVSDSGIVSLHREYFLNIYFCIDPGNASSTSFVYLKNQSQYCNFDMTNSYVNRSILIKHFSSGFEDKLAEEKRRILDPNPLDYFEIDATNEGKLVGRKKDIRYESFIKNDDVKKNDTWMISSSVKLLYTRASLKFNIALFFFQYFQLLFKM